VGGGRAGAATTSAGAVSEYVANAARKRYGYIVQPRRVVSWDHAKLAVPPAPGL
jgi:hypothetical protein